MAAPSSQYRSYEEFEREELFKPEAFVQTLDDFYAIASSDDEGNLFDRPDGGNDKKPAKTKETGAKKSPAAKTMTKLPK